MTNQELKHYGVLGMKWGKRKRGRESTLDNISDNILKPRISKNSIIFPTNFKFNRVGGDKLDFNKSGALFVSYDKMDAAQYIKILGPSLVGNLLNTSHKHHQSIKASKNIKMADDNETNKMLIDYLKNDKKALSTFNDSIYSFLYTNDFSKNITIDDIQSIYNSPNSNSYKKLAYATQSMFGDSQNSSYAESFYNIVRSKGYDAIPDLFDRSNGTSKTAMIILNKDVIEIENITTINKSTYTDAKQLVKQVGNLPISDFIK